MYNKHFPNVPISDVSEYARSRNNNGLKIAIDPFIEEDRLIRYFGGNLLSYGILPVVIIIDNGSEKAVMVEAKNTYLMMDNNNQNLNFTSQNPKEQVYTRDIQIVETINTLTPLTPLMGPLPALAAFAYIHNRVKTETELTESIDENALLDKSLYPGDKHHGFVYFDVKDKITNIKAVKVILKSLKTNEIYEFTFDFVKNK